MSGKRRTILLIAVVAILAAAAAAWLLLSREPEDPNTLLAHGTVEATQARLGFQAAGRLEKILIREGDRVHAGAELAYLDQTEMLAQRDQAMAQVAVAQALLNELESGFRSEEIAQARAATDVAAEQLADAERDAERTRALHEGGAVGRETYEKALLAQQVARSRYNQAEEQLALLETGPRVEQIEAHRAQLAHAEAAVRAIDATLSNMRILAPFGGVITVRHREPAEFVAPGSTVLTLLNPDDRWVKIYVRTDRIGAINLGQSAIITADTYPERQYGGAVVFIASEAEFTPRAVQTTEERVKLVYAVRVRITDDPNYELKPGLPADVRIQLEAS